MSLVHELLSYTSHPHEKPKGQEIARCSVQEKILIASHSVPPKNLTPKQVSTMARIVNNDKNSAEQQERSHIHKPMTNYLLDSRPSYSIFKSVYRWRTVSSQTGAESEIEHILASFLHGFHTSLSLHGDRGRVLFITLREMVIEFVLVEWTASSSGHGTAGEWCGRMFAFGSTLPTDFVLV